VTVHVPRITCYCLNSLLRGVWSVWWRQGHFECVWITAKFGKQAVSCCEAGQRPWHLAAEKQGGSYNKMSFQRKKLLSELLFLSLQPSVSLFWSDVVAAVRPAVIRQWRLARCGTCDTLNVVTATLQHLSWLCYPTLEVGLKVKCIVISLLFYLQWVFVAAIFWMLLNFVLLVIFDVHTQSTFRCYW
jgi:hypothetical protein